MSKYLIFAYGICLGIALTILTPIIIGGIRYALEARARRNSTPSAHATIAVGPVGPGITYNDSSYNAISMIKLIMAGVGFTEDREVALVTDYVNYEIGDFVMRMGTQNKSILFCLQNKIHEETIGCKYSKTKYSYTKIRVAHTKNEIPVDYKYLNYVTNNFIKKMAISDNALELPTDNTTVIHLRLGDVFSREDCHITSCNHYVYTQSDYLRLITSVLPKNNRIVIVGFPFHLPLIGSTPLEMLSDEDLSLYQMNIVRSIQYRTQIAMVFRKHFKEVVFRGIFTPDEDFAYLCSAKHFVQGGGHFSLLISSVVALNKGIVYKP